MNPIRQIEAMARSYVEGELTLSDLEEWLAPNLPLLFQLDESTLPSRLAACIELAIAEMDAEGLDERHVKKAIRELLPDEPLIAISLPAIPNVFADVVLSSNTTHGELVPELPEIRFVPA